MALKKYIVQLRRGEKIVNPDGTVVKDDWGDYAQREPEASIPRLGELVLEYDNGIPRLKIGDGHTPFAELEYMSVDSFILPKPITIKLNGGLKTENNPDGWTKVDNDRFVQEVTAQLIGKITSNSMVDLQPTPEMLAQFHAKDVAFNTVNDDGRIYIYAIGTMPLNTYENLQVTITEVNYNG